jgi:hypothetical protein
MGDHVCVCVCACVCVCEFDGHGRLVCIGILACMSNAVLQ